MWIVLAGLFVASLVWASAFKTVELDGDALVISNYFKTYSVPASHLIRFTKDDVARSLGGLTHRKTARRRATVASALD